MEELLGRSLRQRFAASQDSKRTSQEDSKIHKSTATLGERDGLGASDLFRSGNVSTLGGSRAMDLEVNVEVDQPRAKMINKKRRWIVAGVVVMCIAVAVVVVWLFFNKPSRQEQSKSPGEQKSFDDLWRPPGGSFPRRFSSPQLQLRFSSSLSPLDKRRQIFRLRSALPHMTRCVYRFLEETACCLAGPSPVGNFL